MAEQILSYFTFSFIEIAALALLGFFFLTQVLFYFSYYKRPYSEARKREKGKSSSSEKPKVSVIISSENEAFELAENLPSILSQDYPDFEVIVINNGSTDESDDLLQSLKQKHPNLYDTYVPYSRDVMYGRRKLAFTIGIKAAKGDVLLFTEPYAKPTSDQWISTMIGEMTEGKEVVLGYSFFRQTNKFFNRIARFDNLIFSLQYLAMALKRRPFIGTYRNIAFYKHMFFDRKGFAACLNLDNGEDAFINHILTRDNTAVALSQDSFIEITSDSYPLWKQLKKSYSMIKGHFRSKAPLLFAIEYTTRYFFYFILIGLFAYAGFIQHWALLGISILLFIVRLLIQLIIINKASGYFYSGVFKFSLIVMDVLQPIYNLRFRTRFKKQLVGKR